MLNLRKKVVLLITIFFVMGIRSLSAIDTKITGGRMELKEKGEIVYFSDGVRLDRGNDTLKAHEMRTNKNRDKVEANGSVEFYRKMSSTENCVGYGEEGFYDTRKGEGYLIGHGKQANVVYTQVISSTKTKRIDIVADRFDFVKISSAVIGTGNIYGKTIDPDTGEIYEFWSDRADYNGEKKEMILTGKNQPRARQKNGDDVKNIKGDLLVYNIELKTFEAQGHAEAIFEDATNNTGKK